MIAALALVIVACASPTPAQTIPIPAGALEVRAADIAFAPSRLSVQAGQPFVLYFANGDTLPHNVVIIGSGGARMFVGEIFSGVAQRIQDVPALAPGVYQLHCDVHPEMTGDLEATLSAAQTST
ncbi:MAG: cupredoxin domain-containing protein [Candidatus Limnocylindria bacterium]